MNFRETRGSLADSVVAVFPALTSVLTVAAVPIIWYRVPAVAGVPDIAASSHRVARARICRHLRSPGIDS
jgi:hypothetical protein